MRCWTLFGAVLRLWAPGFIHKTFYSNKEVNHGGYILSSEIFSIYKLKGLELYFPSTISKGSKVYTIHISHWNRCITYLDPSVCVTV